MSRQCTNRDPSIRSGDRPGRFDRGGGSASPFGEQGQLPHGDAKAVAMRSMFDAIAPRYDVLNRLITFRMDVRWRRRTVESLNLPAGSVVLDLACGTGDLCRELQGAGLRAVGADLSLGMLTAARSSAPLVQSDVLELPTASDAVDGVVCGLSLRNLVDLPSFFVEVARVMRSGGRLAILEVAEPTNRVLRWGHSWYFRSVVPRIGALLSDPDAYRYLPASVAYLPSGSDLVAMIEDAGFEAVDRTLLTGGITQLVTATRHGAVDRPLTGDVTGRS